jgi:hypothetical protein
MNEPIRKIQKTSSAEHDKLINLVGRLQGKFESSFANPELTFYGIAFGLEKIADYKIYEIHDDDRLNELSDQISKIQEREGIDDLDSFMLVDPEPYLACRRSSCLPLFESISLMDQKIPIDLSYHQNWYHSRPLPTHWIP